MEGNYQMPLFPDNLYDAQEEVVPPNQHDQMGFVSGLAPAGIGNSYDRGDSWAPQARYQMGGGLAVDKPPLARSGSFSAGAGGSSSSVPMRPSSAMAGSSMFSQLDVQVDSNSASAAPIPTGIWQPGGSGHAFSTHQQQAPTRYPSGFGTQYGIEHLPSGQQIFRAQSPTQQQFRDQGGRWYEARQHQNAHAAALQAQLAARLQDQHSQQQHLLVIEQLQRQRQANMAAAQQAQNRAQGGAALMRDFPQLAQAQQHLMAQQAAARQEAVAAQTAAAVALLHGQQGQAHHHQAWGHAQQQHAAIQQQVEALQALLLQQQRAGGHSNASQQQIYVNALRHLMAAQNLQGQGANQTYAGGMQFSQQAHAYAQNQHLAMAVAQAAKQAHQAPLLQQDHLAGTQGMPHSLIVNQALVAQQLQYLAMQQQQQQHLQQAITSLGLQNSDVAALQALAAKAHQGAGQQQRTLPRQQMQASHLSYHGQSLQAPYRQSSPSLGVLAAAEPPLPQGKFELDQRLPSGSHVEDHDLQMQQRRIHGLAWVTGNNPQDREDNTSDHGSHLPEDLMESLLPAQEKVGSPSAPVGSRLQRYHTVIGLETLRDGSDQVGGQAELSSPSRSTGSCGDVGTVPSLSADEDPKQADSNKEIATDQDSKQPSGINRAAATLPAHHEMLGLGGEGAFDAGNFAFFSGDQFSGVSDLLEELGGAEDDQPDDGDGNLGGDDDDGYGLQLLEGEGEGQGEGSDEGTGSVVDAVQERGLEDVSSRLAALAIGAEVPSSCKQQGNTALERAAPVSRKEGQQGST